MKMPCELIVSHILPTAKGALAKALVNEHGMTQIEIAKLFGVTNAAISQYVKGLRGGKSLIDQTAYKDDFYSMISETATEISRGMTINEAICRVCSFVKNSGLLKALYLFEGYSADHLLCFEHPTIIQIR